MVKYYKKILVDRPWNRPNLTSNGVFGGGEFACTSLTPLQASTYDIWHLFNGIDTGEDLWSSASGQGAFVFYNPNPLKVESFEVVNYYASNNYGINWYKGSVYGSNDNVNWVKLTDYINENHYGSGEHWVIPVNSTGYYKYHKVQILENVGYTSSNRTMAREMYITATQQVSSWAECTQAEYDQLPENNRKIVTDIYNVFVRNSQQSTYRWKQPTLTSNGTIGGNSFAVTSTTATAKSTVFQMFDGKSDTFADLTVPHSTGINMVLYNSIPLNIKKIETVSKLLNTTYGYIGIRNGNVYGSNDGENYTLIKSYTTEHIEKPTIDLSDNKYYYKYYKITTDSWYTAGGYDYCQVVSMNITALTQEKILLNINKTYAPFSKVTDKVYKTFNSPEYTSEIQAQSGVNGIKFTPSNLYGMTNLSSYIRIPQNQKVIFELPDNLVRVNYVNHKGYSIGQVMPPSNINQVDVSNDGTNWTTVATYPMPTYGIARDVTNQLDLPKIKYIRFNFWFHGSGYPSNYGSGGVGSVYINCLIREEGKEKIVNQYYLGG